MKNTVLKNQSREHRIALGMLRSLRRNKFYTSLMERVEKRAEAYDIEMEALSVVLNNLNETQDQEEISSEVWSKMFCELLSSLSLLVGGRTWSLRSPIELYKRVELEDYILSFWKRSSETHYDSRLKDIERVYSRYTFKETCEILGLEPSKKLQKLFSEAFPKGGPRKPGVKTDVTGLSAKEIMQKYPVNRSTAFRAVHTGTIYVQETNQNDVFNVSEIVSRIEETLVPDRKKVSNTGSVYMKFGETLVRVSDHKPAPIDSWTLLEILHPVSIDINPYTIDQYQV